MADNNTTHLPFVQGSKTSLAAADSMRAHAKTSRHRVYEFMLSRGQYGATDDEIEEGLNMKHQSASARRRDLEKKFGAVVATGERRKTRSGRTAQVYAAVPNVDITAPAGRPPKDKDDRYSEKVTVYLTRVQYRQLKLMAERSKKTNSPSDVMRSAFTHLRDQLGPEYWEPDLKKDWY